MYGVFRLRDPMRTCTIVRKDWLDKVGMSMPKTTDDLYQLAKAFTTKDPNGDGKKDTYLGYYSQVAGGLRHRQPL